MYKKYVVRLTDQERGQIETLVRSGRAHARKLLYARILLKADSDGPHRWTDERIAEALEVSTATVAREGQALLRGGAGGGAYAQEARQAQKEGARRASRSSPDRPLVLGSS